MIRRLLLYLLPKNQIANGSNKCKSGLIKNIEINRREKLKWLCFNHFWLMKKMLEKEECNQQLFFFPFNILAILALVMIITLIFGFVIGKTCMGEIILTRTLMLARCKYRVAIFQGAKMKFFKIISKLFFHRRGIFVVTLFLNAVIGPFLMSHY